MSALQFINPMILVGLPAIALPILIHFLTRARPRRIRYPTLRFLIEAGSGRQALYRLRVLVLLALRALAVAALVLVFAKPFWSSAGAQAPPGAARRAVIVIDASLSMRAVQGGIPLFVKASAEASEVLSGLDPGSQAAVIFIGARPRAVLPVLSENISVLREALAKGKPTMEAGRPDLALAMAAKMVSGAGEPGSVYVFSDFQRSNWGAVSPEGLGAACFLRRVNDVAVPNAAIRIVVISPAEPVAGEMIELACKVFNCTGAKRLEKVSLQVDGAGVLREADVSLQPFSSAEASFSFELHKVGDYPGKVTVSHDDLVDDNVRYFNIRVRRELTALVISDAGPSDRRCAAHFVATALAPSERAGTGLKVVRRHSQDTDQAVIDAADTVVIVSPAALPGRVAESVAERVTRGASLICLLDGPTSPGILGALASSSGGAISPPFHLAGQMECKGSGEPLGAAVLAGGVLRLFADASQGDLSGICFMRHHRTSVIPDRKGEVLVYHKDGSVALSISPAGAGSAVFGNFPATMDGGNLVRRGIFPALIAEIMRALRRSGDRQAAVPGLQWTVDLAAGGAEKATYRVIPPMRPAAVDGDGREAIVPAVVARGRTVRLAVPSVPVPGHYVVELIDGEGGATRAAVGIVNVDPAESDTRAIDLSFLAQNKGSTTVAVVDDEGGLKSAGAAKPLWPVLAGIAAALVGAEMLLLALWRRPGRVPAEQRFVRGAL